MTLSRFFYTVRYLRPVQLYGRLWFRFARPRTDLNPAPGVRVPVAGFAEPAQRLPSVLGAERFEFLNRQGDLREPCDWNTPEKPKLWLYNLHYFDDLNAEASAARTSWHEALIQRWISENPPSLGNGWEPYPTSLRIVNWIKWSLRGHAFKQNALDSLAVQARWLRRRLEVHLLGNHLFANAKALVFAGLFFKGQEADQWLSTGCGLLEREIPEQILPDGGHFELSPMYHLILLEDLLDLINVSRAFGKAPAAIWVDAAQRMLAWAQVMRHPDGDIPFFNDAASSIAPVPRKIEAYAARLGMQATVQGAESVYLADSGYAKATCGPATLFMDVAKVGPDYLPGHAHADTLSFEVSLGKRRLLVNSGTSTYASDQLRSWQRSTEAHNTVRIDENNSSEVWAAFRVARRAKPSDVKFVSKPDGVEVNASHDGYCRLNGSPIHRRTWQLKDHSLSIHDLVTGKGIHTFESFLHFHPDVLVQLANSKSLILLDRSSEAPLASLDYQGEGVVEVRDGLWYPEFGKAVANQYCVFRQASTALPVEVGLRIVWPDPLTAHDEQ